MKNTAKAGIVFFSLLLIFSVVVCILFRPFLSGLRLPEYRDQFIAWIAMLGFKGALILLAIQILQIIVAIIPGGPMELLAGAAYGALGGFGLCILGCLIATTVIFHIVQTFGAPLVTRFFRRDLTEKYAFLRNTRKVTLIIFLLFLIPGIPKDALTYIAPLANIKRSRFLLISVTARSPAILASTMLGSSILQGNWVVIVILFVLIAVTGIIGALYGDRIIAKFR
jgi:uncharacterized membrane protein YdjX (TVP38/TMEM64 family)